MSVKRLNKFFQTADIDKNVVIRDSDSGKAVLTMYLCLLELVSVSLITLMMPYVVSSPVTTACENSCILSNLE